MDDTFLFHSYLENLHVINFVTQVSELESDELPCLISNDQSLFFLKDLLFKVALQTINVRDCTNKYSIKIKK